MNLQVVKETLLEIDPSLVGNEVSASYHTAVVVLSALTCGPDVVRLAKFTKLPREFIATIHQRMIRAGIWTELEVFSDHWHVAPRVINPTAFWLDVLVGLGLVVRTWDEEKGYYLYASKEHALEEGMISPRASGKFC